MNGTPDYSVFLAAYYKAADPNLTQQAIGARAGLGTQAQVSRLLADARSKGYLREVFEFPADMPPDERRALQQRQTMRLRWRFAQTADKVQGLRAKEIGRIDQPIAELFQWTAEQQAGARQCQLYMHAFLRAVRLADDIFPARTRI